MKEAIIKGAPSPERKVSLRKCTFEQVCRMQRDNFAYGDYWFIVDAGSGTVTLAQQKSGQAATASITMPRRAFSHFVDAYNREQELEPA